MAAQQAILYQYKGKNKQGKTIQGEMRAQNPTVVKSQLRKQGILNANVKKKPKPLFSSSKAIKPADIALLPVRWRR